MLAYLWQEEPDVGGEWLGLVGVTARPRASWEVETQAVVAEGRLDLLVTVPDEAVVIVESKLGSGFGVDQPLRYVRHLKQARTEPSKSLVILTRDAVAPPAQALAEAGDEVDMLCARWQDFVCVEPAPETLAAAFVEMLQDEGLVMPPAVTTEDWRLWHDAAAVVARLETLLNEARPAMDALLPNPTKSGRLAVAGRWVYRIHNFATASVGLGFIAYPSPKRPHEKPAIWSFVLNPQIEARDRAAAAQKAIEGSGDSAVHSVNWGEWPTRYRDVTDVLS